MSSLLFNSPLLDDANKLTDSINFSGTIGTVTTGTVAFVDLGQQGRQYAGAPGATDTSAPASAARLAIHVRWSSLDVTYTGVYWVWVEGSNVSNFATFERLGVLFLGESVGASKLVNSPANGRETFYVDNVVFGSATDANAMIPLRYIRLRIAPFGGGGTPVGTITGAWYAIG